MCFPRAFPSAEKAMVDSSAWLHAGWFSRACWVELAGGPCVSLAFFVRPGAYFTRRPLQHGRSLQHFLRRPGHSSSKVCSCWPSLTIEAHCPWRWRRRAKPCLAAWRRPRRAFRSPIALHPSLPRCFPPQHQAPPSCPAVLLSCLAVLCRRGQGHAVHVVQVYPVLVLLFQCGFQLCNEVVDVEVVIAAVGFGVCAVAVFHHGLPHRCPHFRHWHPPEASTDKKTASEYKTGSTRSGANYNSNARIFLLIQYAYNMPRPLGEQLDVRPQASSAQQRQRSAAAGLPLRAASLRWAGRFVLPCSRPSSVVDGPLPLFHHGVTSQPHGPGRICCQRRQAPSEPWPAAEDDQVVNWCPQDTCRKRLQTRKQVSNCTRCKTSIWLLRSAQVPLPLSDVPTFAFHSFVKRNYIFASEAMPDRRLSERVPWIHLALRRRSFFYTSKSDQVDPQMHGSV